MSDDLSEEEIEETPQLTSPTGILLAETPHTGLESACRSLLEQASEEAKNDPTGSESEEMSGTMPINKVTLGGIEISTVKTPSTTVAGSLGTLKKADRAKLDPDKRQELFSRITKRDQQDKFRLLSQSIANVDDPQETYDLQLNLLTLQTAINRYDIGDVFDIVFPKVDADGKQTGSLLQKDSAVKTLNLFADFNALTAKNIAESSIWYARWPDTASALWFQENLSLSFDYLQNHMEHDLWGKVMEDMQPYFGTQAQGGPLVFYFMIKRLQVNSQLAIDALHAKLKSLRIDQYPGEDESALVGHARAIFRRLRSLEKKASDGTVVNPTLPVGINQTLMTLFQTSSDTKFTEIFHTKEIQMFEATLDRGDKAYGDPAEKILDLAVQVYTNILSSKEGWTGQFHKVNDSGFTSSDPNVLKCHNCGGNHLLKDCPEPKNDERCLREKCGQHSRLLNQFSHD